ncbi:DNA polymerase III subunit chi [Bosea sp. (in: a-proteobacteria)]|uniref:DNA polymerase III subunit chi n=1 Tax=Bosea sp. (in: a-proteobacteria) TaxID=1871050 RepID=UPI002734534C|nr:DNA polymerase III subunit chi [Bosea sp. (in: a-proteobacteria)]MDP3409582.1 DNA polymerase III subunit chi [Bosea sp. (in: a-proteobacteria)]
MAEILFFHLQSRPLEQVLPTILDRALARGQKVVVEVSSQERLSALDDHLWTYSDESFLPHVTAMEADAPQNPVVLTTQPHNPNAAQVRICTEGVRIPDALAGYERIVLIFDGDDPDALTAAREDWKKAKALNLAASYWQQDDTGRWEKKA